MPVFKIDGQLNEIPMLDVVGFPSIYVYKNGEL